MVCRRLSPLPIDTDAVLRTLSHKKSIQKVCTINAIAQRTKKRIYVLNVLWPPANDHLSLSTELGFVPIITIDKIGFFPATSLYLHVCFAIDVSCTSGADEALHKSSTEAEECLNCERDKNIFSAAPKSRFEIHQSHFAFDGASASLG